jgi:hypothetical protein
LSLTVREEHRLRVVENRVLRGIGGPEGEKVVGGCRTLHNEELHNLYCSPNMISVIKWRRMAVFFCRHCRKWKVVQGMRKHCTVVI